MSVLVDERFAGSWDDLRAARAATSLPLLAKGFFSTAEHLRTAREAGADAVLLILRDLDDAACAALMREADALGLDTLVEAHDADELARATALGAPVIGVNARDLSTFEIDRRAQLELLAQAPRDRIVIAESAIETRAQGAAAELAGAKAMLVGSTLMRAPDPGREARRAALAAARQGLRADAPGRRRRRGRGGRRPRRLHPRPREPAPHRRAARRARDRAARRGLRRRGARDRRRPRPVLRARERPPRARRRPAPRRRAGRNRRRPAVGERTTRRTSSARARPPAA